MPANVFLLTHKCGNHFIEDIFNSDNSKTQGYVSLKKAGFDADRESFYNVRCRNFSKEQTKRTVDLLGVEGVKYFLFTRHPASFFKSATTYHLRGNERWSRTKEFNHLGGKTLYESLHNCDSFGEQLVVSMKHFGVKNRFINYWIENLKYLKNIGADYSQIKCEDVWKDLNAVKEFHKAIVHSGFSVDFEQVLRASPIGMADLKRHSTGQFQKKPFDDYDDLAKGFYDKNFKNLERSLNY